MSNRDIVYLKKRVGNNGKVRVRQRVRGAAHSSGYVSVNNPGKVYVRNRGSGKMSTDISVQGRAIFKIPYPKKKSRITISSNGRINVVLKNKNKNKSKVASL